MNFLKKIGLFFWAIWCMLAMCFFLFCSLLGMIFCFYIYPSKKMIYLAHFIPPWVSKWCVRFWGIKFNIHNEEALNPKQNCIIVINHSSDLDPFFGSYIFRNFYAKYLAKAEILKYPIFGMALSNMYIPVQRGDKRSREESYKKMIEVVNEKKCSLIIYPEGTRNKGPQVLRDFHDGAFRVAIETKIPILVGTLTNSFFIMKPRSWVLYPQTLNVYIEDPISTDGMTSEDIPALRNLVREKMLSAFAKENIHELI